MHKREILIDFLLLVIVLASFIALLVSSGFMLVTMFSSVSRSTINSSSIGALVSMILLLLVSFALLGRRLDSRDNCETQSMEDQFEQKYIALMTDDTKARREFIELYRKKEG